jgi:hypothetical protein
VIEAPGDYAWEVRPHKADEDDVAPLVQSEYSVKPDFYALQLLEPLVGGAAVVSNELQDEVLKDFEITLRWKEYKTARKYHLKLMQDSKSGKPLMERDIDETKYELNKNKVYNGKIYYQLMSELPSGFRVISESQPFMFNFLGPKPVMPQDGAQVSAKGMASGDQTILLTWQKTNFTELYQVELAKDAAFARPVFKKRLKENFLVLQPLAVGKYWWRIRSISGDLESPPSKPITLILTP